MAWGPYERESEATPALARHMRAPNGWRGLLGLVGATVASAWRQGGPGSSPLRAELRLPASRRIRDGCPSTRARRAAWRREIPLRPRSWRSGRTAVSSGWRLGPGGRFRGRRQWGGAARRAWHAPRRNRLCVCASRPSRGASSRSFTLARSRDRASSRDDSAPRTRSVRPLATGNSRKAQCSCPSGPLIVVRPCSSG